MKDLIWGSVGLVIAAAAAVYLIRLLVLKKRGLVVLAEVTAVSEIQRGKGAARKTVAYTHTLRYEIDGKTYEHPDRAEYTQAFAQGSKQLIVCDSKSPEKFVYENDLKKDIIIVAALIAVALVFSAKWLMNSL